MGLHRLTALAAIAAVFTVVHVDVARAQSYPNKPLRIMVPFPPGGSTDVMARSLAVELTKSLGQPVVVENKAGANGNIGSAEVAKAAPDGYTLLLAGVGTNAINHSLYPTMPYDSLKDFEHITLLAEGPNVLIVNPNFPVKSVPELIAMAKAQPGKLNFGSNGNGSSGRLAMEMLRQATGMDMVHVPYKGGGPAMQALLAGEVPMLFTNQDAALPQVKAGKVRAIGVASEKRNPAYPDVPTVAEQGITGFSAVSWFGLSAPAKTPPEIVKRLHAEAVKAINQPEFRARLEGNGFVVVGSTPEQFRTFVTSENAKWGKAVKASGATVD
ncbi:MAG: tripartite tricarboxylate transporter substrate binding protein [Pseudomonadota bacterium]|nr:tripartite tricarboxylate transporter substrate binding protein [Burkholderiaceae bacterium]MDQ3446134.1 tripartite tricarboxylate transporter substrate binding protein [Pseudomonadota bacterium]